MKTFLTLSFAFAIQSFASAQNIPDGRFAQAIRFACFACIDSSDNLTPAADTLTYLDVSSYQISDLSGVAGFDNLQTLLADYNPIDSLPALPASLRKVSAYLSNLRNIDNISNLPNLETLDVSYGMLTALPALTNSIKDLRAYHNSISQVQNFPAQVRFLDISYNRLTSLLPLGDSLTHLDISFNQFDSLNIIGADNLDTLFAQNNSIEHIQSLPYRLKFLNVSENLLTTLSALPFSIQTLWAEFNQIDSINRLNQLVNLKQLQLSYNQLSMLPNLPNNLEELYISNNDLTSLPALPAALKTVYFNGNQISQWPNFGNSIRMINAADNQLTSINVLPDSLQYLYVDNNPQLNCLPEIPPYLFTLGYSGTPINCLPNARQIQVTVLGLPVCDSTNNSNHCLVLGVENTPAPTFMVSPNPFHNYLTVQNSDLLDDNSQLYLYNNLGQLVKQQRLFSNNENIDVSALQPAVYYLTIKTSKGSFSQKVVKN